MSIKEKLTKEEAVRRHRELWNKIAELCTSKDIGMGTGDSIKYIALKSLGYDDPLCAPTNRCWACEYAINKAIYLYAINKAIYLHKCNSGLKVRILEDMCHFCPIKWKTTQCHDEGGEYEIWIRHLVVGEFEDAAEMARVIANLPEKKEVKEDD